MVRRGKAEVLLLLGLLPVFTMMPGALATAQGAVKLDNMTFEKFVNVPGQTILVKFDEAYAYGEKEDAFKTLCQVAYSVKNFFVGEVPVQEYGDKDNDDMRERFGLKKEDFPAYLLFKGSAASPVRFEGFGDPAAKQPANWDEGEDGPWEPPMLKDITAENLIKWLKMQGTRMPRIGGIPDLDAVVKRFFTEGMKDADVAAAQTLADDGEHKENTRAALYPKIMKKIKEKGEEYVAKETARVQKLMAGKITEEKRDELEDKLKVLNVFASKEEL